ncbi:hypothetical protein [Actinomadura xylanilytica]|uniref:hypothetical protein n=1 Tax=Actinomadura xylanilytica TaxID=887459 RepID=UPI00255AF8C8|nr:hypothetical protein [Actinomadura xylanilytica]MDL4776129.1 hypothetical protein [Actinomadura xylanilytica]
MRFLIILAALALAAVVIVLIVYAIGGAGASASAPPGSSRWETRTESDGGVTTVVVRRVTLNAAGEQVAETGRQIVATIPDGDPEWEARYQEAMAQARTRVATLEVESD